ncbi:hypothetical protein HDU84_001610 [Entophlyctis sp. JEL0112]|nr:hypothetical protein HDU84_001610 [Entophlyctis sp. JEL0112]
MGSTSVATSLGAIDGPTTTVFFNPITALSHLSARASRSGSVLDAAALSPWSSKRDNASSNACPDPSTDAGTNSTAVISAGITASPSSSSIGLMSATSLPSPVASPSCLGNSASLNQSQYSVASLTKSRAIISEQATLPALVTGCVSKGTLREDILALHNAHFRSASSLHSGGRMEAQCHSSVQPSAHGAPPGGVQKRQRIRGLLAVRAASVSALPYRASFDDRGCGGSGGREARQQFASSPLIASMMATGDPPFDPDSPHTASDSGGEFSPVRADIADEIEMHIAESASAFPPSMPENGVTSTTKKPKKEKQHNPVNRKAVTAATKRVPKQAAGTREDKENKVSHQELDESQRTNGVSKKSTNVLTLELASKEYFGIEKPIFQRNHVETKNETHTDNYVSVLDIGNTVKYEKSLVTQPVGKQFLFEIFVHLDKTIA